jgi:hypothetical protein
MIVEVATKSRLVCALCRETVTLVSPVAGRFDRVMYCLSCETELTRLFTAIVQVPVGCLYIGGSERLVVGEIEMRVRDE